MADEPTSPLFCFLFEIIHGNIGPDIPAKINQDGIDSFHGIKMCSKIIVVFNLGVYCCRCKPKFILQKSLANLTQAVVGKATS